MKVLIALVVVSFLSGCDLLAQDKCLDSGGRWNKEEHHCEYAENQQQEDAAKKQ